MDPDTQPEDGGTSPRQPTAPIAADRLGEHTDGSATPLLALDGFSGPLDHLLIRARAQTIDLAALSLTALLDQLSLALRQAPAAMPLGQKGDWVVMAAWLLQLRTRLLLPAEVPAQQQATVEADQLRAHLMARQTALALADWLAHRPQLGHDVFVCGRPDGLGIAVDAAQAVDRVEFLWAGLALFDDAPVTDTTLVYWPQYRALYTVAAARDRILQRLAANPEGGPLARFLPDPPTNAAREAHPLQTRSAWSSTFLASLELAKQGEVVLGQGEAFQPVHLARV